MFANKFLNKTYSGVAFSALMHAVLAGGLYYALLIHKPAPIVAELDLSMVPMVYQPPNAGGGSGAKPSETWTVPKKEIAPAPPPEPTVIETKEEVQKVENAAPPCENCDPNAPLVGQGSGGGTGEGDGPYVPEEQTARKPRWVRNFITSRDYPSVARNQGKDGRVVLTVLIDQEGRVRDARLLQGSYEQLNEVALRKVREAIFTPAINHENRAVSCKVTLPIRFELR